MNSTVIRFVEEKEFLIDDIQNGFVLRTHPISFKPSIPFLLPSLVSFWKDKGITSEFIDLIVTNFDKLNEDKFCNWFIQKIASDDDFEFKFSYITTQIRDANIKMKCFTELRDNQKMHPHHRNYFGDYGVSLTIDWIKKNRGDRVIYVDKDSETTNRIARLMSMLFSSVDGKDVRKSVFDVLAFTEIEGHSHEYEWRIVGNHNIGGKSYGDYPEKIPFSNNDIVAIYVKESSEIDVFEELLENKRKKEGGKKIPIYLTDDIYLTIDELLKIEKIYARRVSI